MENAPIKWKVISAREGDCWLSPYVPLVGRQGNYLGDQEVSDQLVAAVAQNSGVTVATGFDLGTKSKTELSLMGLPAAIRKKIDRYCGKSRRDAMVELHEAIAEVDDPYTIDLTETEADLLDTLNKNYMRTAIRISYDKCVAAAAPDPLRPSRQRFNELDVRVRTAIVCFCFQFGQNLDKYASMGEPRRTFVRLASSQQWLDLASFLKTLKNDRVRRQIEAAEFFDFCNEDSQRRAPTTMDGRALKGARENIERHDTAAKAWKGPGRPPEW